MKTKSSTLLGMTLTAASISTAFAIPSEDPFLWLEEVEGTQALDWVKKENARTQTDLEGDPLYGSLYQQARDLYFAQDRTAFAYYYRGYFYNFWQDATHKHGILRRALPAEYRKPKPQWETVLDLDALSLSENENWVYKGFAHIDRDAKNAMLLLSRGGKDAVVAREIELDHYTFVKNGFSVPEAKTDIVGLDRDHIFIGSDFGPGSLTQSGYPRTVRLWARGQELAAALEVFSVQESDLSASAYVARDGDKKYTFFIRSIDFYSQEYFLREANGQLREMPFPKSARFEGIRDEKLYLLLKEPLHTAHGTVAANSVVRIDLNAPDMQAAEILFSANAKQAIEQVSIQKDRVWLELIEDVRSKVLELTPAAPSTLPWLIKELPYPNTGVLSLSPRDPNEADSHTLLTFTDFLTPTSQYLVQDTDGSHGLEQIKQSVARFDSSQFESEQRFVQSKDGTLVPYFIVKAKNTKLDGTNPTLLYGYGGFEHSMTPYYSGVNGKLWLERGGVYVLANIRGGGEYGPAWHQAALKHNRQRAYDDFIAIAQSLISRGVTSPEHLGIMGGSNGGLLIGAVMTQRPELFGAAVIQVPLLDMLRFHKLLAGASWMGEYGDPENAADCAALLSYSPYHNVKSAVRYPTPFFRTSTKDDRVHPGHARKMAALMQSQGHGFYYYENINGGHAGAANLDESAHAVALEYTYLWKRLGRSSGKP